MAIEREQKKRGRTIARIFIYIHAKVVGREEKSKKL